MELPKSYNPKEVEERIYRRWEKSGFFNPDNLPPFAKASGGKPAERAKSFVVMMPPPNITGSLHLGHALEAAATDCLIRMKRMQGFRALYFPGTDHAGIATQNVVEKELKKERLTRHGLGRKKFLDRVWAWKETYGGIILEQFKKLGVSADWSRQRFTLDEGYAQAVDAAFQHYYDKGWIYKGERVINYCTRCATSLSDLEVEYKSENGKLYYIKYPLTQNPKPKTLNPKQTPNSKSQIQNFIIVATTRPETMLGDTAVAVHPNDKRYKKLVGKAAILPLVGREVPIIADAAVEKEFGTGAVKVTPAHDFADAEIGERHGLARIKVIGENGRITAEAPEKYRAMPIKEAREAVISDLKKDGLLEREEDYTHNVAVCYRCEIPVEPLPSPQWFLKMKDLSALAKKAYESGAVKIVPENFKKVALNWLENERDWCISRQLWWGHKIPIKGEDDVLDTWFSSALWPFATLGWPDACEASRETTQKSPVNAKQRETCMPKKGSDLEKFYPTQWMTSARDILNLWIERMVFSGLEFMGRAPFPEVWIHPTVLTKEGKRMSKSLGTGIDPLQFIEQYGADATRFGLLWQMSGLQDIRFDESALQAGKKFLNKIWNATRFALQYAEGTEVPERVPQSPEANDQKILAAFHAARGKVEREIAALRFGQALETFYAFFWHAFCDQYLEQIKTRRDSHAKKVLWWTLAASLSVLHPFIPFITEELWQKLPHQKAPKLLMITEWPEGSKSQ